MLNTNRGSKFWSEHSLTKKPVFFFVAEPPKIDRKLMLSNFVEIWYPGFSRALISKIASIFTWKHFFGVNSLFLGSLSLSLKV